MPTARIITRFPDRAASLRKTLLDSGYKVEVVPPERSSGFADIEYDLDSSDENLSSVAQQQPIIAQPVVQQPAQPRKAREPILAKRIEQLRTQLDSAKSGIASQMEVWRSNAERRIRDYRMQAAEAAHLRAIKRAEEQQVKEGQLAAHREQQRIAEERAREEAAIALRERQHREAERQAQIAAEMERRRQEQARAAEQARLATAARQQEAQLAAPALDEQADERAQEEASNVAVIPQRRRPLSQRWQEFSDRASDKIHDWFVVHANDDFSSTRDYAWRQAIPAAVGLAIAFVCGWALAMGSTRASERNSVPPPVASASPLPAVTPPLVPVAAKNVSSTTKAAKPSAATRKAATAKPRVYRRQTEDAVDEEEDDVVVIRHASKNKELIASTDKKNGVKTISDLE